MTEQDLIDALTPEQREGFEHLLESYRNDASRWEDRAKVAEGLLNQIAELLPPIREGGTFWYSELPGQVARNLA